ncbi:MAG: FG-GAP repeat protein [Planctomycetota bacterium]
MRLLPAITIACLFLATVALGQCVPEQVFSPSAFPNDFGGSVELSDRHLLVGDVTEHSICGDVFCSNGMVFAYERGPDGEWLFTQSITPAGLGVFGGFGSGLRLDRDRFMSAAREIVGPGMSSVHEFLFDGERWVEGETLLAPDGRKLIKVLALRGDTALIRDDFENLLRFRLGDDGWAYVDEIRNPDVPAPTRTGYGGAVLDDDWIIVSAFNEALIAPNGGAVYVYRRTPGDGIELHQKLIAPDVMDGPRFGSSLALQGDELLVGSQNSDRMFTSEGVVYAYDLIDELWMSRGEIGNPDPQLNDSFGKTMALSGDQLVVASVSDRTPLSLGASYLFERDLDGQWQYVADLFPTSGTGQFGADVEVWGDTIAIGSPDTIVGDEAPGSFYLFDATCTPCVADLDTDGRATIYDYLMFFNLFEARDPIADLDGDRQFTLFDFMLFQDAFDAGC